MRYLLLISCFFTLLYGDVCYAEEYSRDLFPHWTTSYRPLSTRQQALADSVLATIHVQGNLPRNIWLCPYTGSIITNPSKLDADHIVPLKWAWDHGASEWDLDTRTAFANDPENILMVVAGSNRSKGAKGPSEWLPPNLAHAESYLNRFMIVCEKYRLEYDAFAFEQVREYIQDNDKGIKIELNGGEK